MMRACAFQGFSLGLGVQGQRFMGFCFFVGLGLRVRGLRPRD